MGQRDQRLPKQGRICVMNTPSLLVMWTWIITRFTMNGKQGRWSTSKASVDSTQSPVWRAAQLQRIQSCLCRENLLKLDAALLITLQCHNYNSRISSGNCSGLLTHMQHGSYHRPIKKNPHRTLVWFCPSTQALWRSFAVAHSQKTPVNIFRCLRWWGQRGSVAAMQKQHFRH